VVSANFESRAGECGGGSGREEPVGAWLIRLSSIRNEFALHWHAPEWFPPLVCRLRYDGLAGEKKVYAAVTERKNHNLRDRRKV
jgi:hypothetical protein